VNGRRTVTGKRLPMIIRSMLGAVLLALMFMPASLKAQESALLDYRLHVQDKVKIRVYEWRESLGELYEWSAINGEQIVNASGMVSLPLIRRFRD
jgi:protein involved in polysaccharide export with SLBB domain